MAAANVSLVQDDSLQPEAALRPETPLQPELPQQPELPAPSEGLGQQREGEVLGGGLSSFLQEWRTELGTAAGAPASVISPIREAAPPVDLGGALEQSDTVQSMNVQLRNLASLDPHIRGYRYGQIYTQGDGAYWIPVRQDLDTPLSMFDPAVVRAIEVVPGPYSLRYGPGLSYLNIATMPTPRYDSFEMHAYTPTSYYGNGNLLNATQRVYGGSKNYGFSFIHGTRDGNHYTSGNGSEIPSRYNNEDYFIQFGFDPDADRHVEFRYLRQDQTDTQYPGQFFKTNVAVTQGFNLQFINDDPDGPVDRTIKETWYNIGNLKGGTDPGEHIFDVVQRVDQALMNAGIMNPNFSATTNAATITTGGRLSWIIGDEDTNQLTSGIDFRYVNQYVNENLQYTDTGAKIAFSTGLPRAFYTDAGLFSEYKMLLASYWTATAGTRVDWLHSDLANPLPSNYPNQLGDQLAQNNALYSFFLTNQVELDEYWTMNFGFAHAQRPPTLTERYADGEFLAILQSGFSRVIGLPTLAPERAWQLDGSLSCETEVFRGRLTGFFSFINNYSTFIAFPILDPTGARLLFTTATPLATLAGFEGYAERDLNSKWTVFGSILYVSGRDQTLGAPLPQIYPLDSRVGFRWHDPDGGNRWGVEMFARMVSRQDRLGTLREGFTGDQRVVVELPNAGFTVTNLRAYYNASENWSYVAGINNVFNTNYLEFLSLRFAPSANFPGVAVLSPGFTPYVGINMTYYAHCQRQPLGCHGWLVQRALA